MKYVFEGVSFDDPCFEVETKPGFVQMIWQKPKLILVFILVAILYPIYIGIRIQRTVRHWWIPGYIRQRIETAYWRLDGLIDQTANTIQHIWIGFMMALISPLLEMKGVACA